MSTASMTNLERLEYGAIIYTARLRGLTWDDTAAEVGLNRTTCVQLYHAFRQHTGAAEVRTKHNGRLRAGRRVGKNYRRPKVIVIDAESDAIHKM